MAPPMFLSGLVGMRLPPENLGESLVNAFETGVVALDRAKPDAQRVYPLTLRPYLRAEVGALGVYFGLEPRVLGVRLPDEHDYRKQYAHQYCRQCD